MQGESKQGHWKRTDNTLRMPGRSVTPDPGADPPLKLRLPADITHRTHPPTLFPVSDLRDCMFIATSDALGFFRLVFDHGGLLLEKRQGIQVRATKV